MKFLCKPNLSEFQIYSIYKIHIFQLLEFELIFALECDLCLEHMIREFSDTGCHSPPPLRESRPEIQVRKSAEGKMIRIYVEGRSFG